LLRGEQVAPRVGHLEIDGDAVAVAQLGDLGQAALIGRQRYQEQIVAQEAAVLSQRRLAEVAQLRYENGISIYLEVVDARRNLFSAEQQLIQLRATALQNGVALYVALGGGREP